MCGTAVADVYIYTMCTCLRNGCARVCGAQMCGMAEEGLIPPLLGKRRVGPGPAR